VLSLALDTGKWWASRPGGFTPMENSTGASEYEAGWVPESKRNISCLQWESKQAIQLVARHNIDWANPTPMFHESGILFYTNQELFYDVGWAEWITKLNFRKIIANAEHV
jgi:hypothetical protein